MRRAFIAVIATVGLALVSGCGSSGSTSPCPLKCTTSSPSGPATRRCAVSDDLAKAGEPADRVIVILEGLACRHKLLPDGRRQILAYLFPGDMGDPRQVMQSRVDYSMCVLWPTEIATLNLASIQRLERYANISTAMARYSLMQQAVMREWLGRPGMEHGASADLVCFVDDPRQGAGVVNHPALVILRGRAYR